VLLSPLFSQCWFASASGNGATLAETKLQRVYHLRQFKMNDEKATSHPLTAEVLWQRFDKHVTVTLGRTWATRTWPSLSGAGSWKQISIQLAVQDGNSHAGGRRQCGHHCVSAQIVFSFFFILCDLPSIYGNDDDAMVIILGYTKHFVVLGLNACSGYFCFITIKCDDVLQCDWINCWIHVWENLLHLGEMYKQNEYFC
jgi:hypothetical protein